MPSILYLIRKQMIFKELYVEDKMMTMRKETTEVFSFSCLISRVEILVNKMSNARDAKIHTLNEVTDVE